jgi:hypothetical protein
MTALILRDLIDPVHAGLMAEFGVPATPEAACLSLAAGNQESKFQARDQGDPAIIGPATGYWQFEKMGGVWEILNSGQTKAIAADLCARARVAAQPDPVWRLFATAAGDELACSFARLLTWKDRAALPAVSLAAEQEAYDYYDRNWRPGAKRRDDWTRSWADAVRVMSGQAVGGVPSPPAVAAPAPGPDALAALSARVERLERRLAAVGVAAVG